MSVIGLSTPGSPYGSLGASFPRQAIAYGGTVYAPLMTGGPKRLNGSSWEAVPDPPAGADIYTGCVHGAVLAFATYEGDCWTYNGSSWTAIAAIGMDYTNVLLSISGTLYAFGGSDDESDGEICEIKSFNGSTWSSVLTDASGGEIDSLCSDGSTGYVLAATNYGETQIGLYGESSFFAWAGPGDTTLTRTGGGGDRYGGAAALIGGVPHIVLAGDTAMTVDRWTGSAWETVEALDAAGTNLSLLPYDTGAIVLFASGLFETPPASTIGYYDGSTLVELYDFAPSDEDDDQAFLGWIADDDLTLTVYNATDGARLIDFEILESVPADLEAVYHILEPVPSELEAIYHILEPVPADLEAPYDLRLAADLEAPYDIGAGVEIEMPYDVRLAVDLATLYDQRTASDLVI